MIWNLGPYTWRLLAQRPWVTVADGDGFPERSINRYLAFVAWQDHAPASVRADARHLAQAATWLSFHQQTWVTADLTLWAQYCAAVAWELPPGLPARFRAQRHISTLHRAYAFWHWDDPRALPFQPFPGRRQDRAAWVDQAVQCLETGP